MKRKALLGATLAVASVLTIGVSSLNGGSMAQLGADIMSSFEQALVFADTDVKTTQVVPESPLFLNDFNLYQYHVSEQGLIADYIQYVRTDAPLGTASYFTEVMSYVERVSRNPNLNRDFFEVLPIWPDYNMATYGNLTAYLFPMETDPLAFAIERGFVKPLVKPGEYMSPYEVVNLVGKIFIDGDQNANLLLEDLGLIGEGWDRRGKGDFRLVEAVRLILRLREAVEGSRILAAQETVESQLVDLPAGAVTLGDSLHVLTRAFLAEARASYAGRFDHRQAHQAVSEEFGFQMTRVLTADVIDEVRSAYFKHLGVAAPAVYELPEQQYLGECTNELFRKTYMGPVVRVPRASYMSCGRITIQIPAGYIIGLNSLPKIGELSSGTYRIDALNSLKNVLVIGDSSDGEQMVRIVYTPEKMKSKVGKGFRYQISTQDGKQVAAAEKAYNDIGAEVKILPRQFSGSNILTFTNL